MKINNIHLLYFSATGSTQRLLRDIAKGLNINVIEQDITLSSPKSLLIEPTDLLLVGMPVYAGRIPQLAAERLQEIKGVHTPAIAICVYGNRDFDDALLELTDIIGSNGFSVLGAAAFSARHSIFPKLAANRPDSDDLVIAIDFAKQCVLKINEEMIDGAGGLGISGNRPYKQPGAIPFVPKGNSNCTHCGICSALCPTGAIDAATPCKTDKRLCISCARCISGCPQNARAFRGLLYAGVGKLFVSKNSEPKRNRLFL